MNQIIDKGLSILEYFLYPIPGSKFNYYVTFLVIAAVLAVGGIALKIYIKKTGSENRSFKKLFHNVPYYLFWVVTFLLLNLAARHERFPLVGARFVLYITCLAALYLIGKNLYVFFKVYPTEKNRFKETPSQKKYTIEKHSRR